MLRVGITGGIGSGKSIVARVFSEMGYPVFNSDREAKRLLSDDQQIRAAVIEIFGVEAYNRGTLDRKFIAQKVFNDPLLLSKLNAIVHPATRKAFEEFTHIHRNAPLVLNEAAILFETGAYLNFDKIILVTAPADLRIRRVMQRDHVDKKQVEERLVNQWDDQRKEPLASFVVRNDDHTPVLTQIQFILSQLQ